MPGETLDPSTTSAGDSTSTGPGPTTSPAPGSSSGGMDESSSGGSSDGSSSSGEPATDDGPATTSTECISVCGNNVIECDEVCDLAQLAGETCISLGNQGGQLGCSLTCDSYNELGCFICGNGVVDIAEDCESVVPDGVTCESMGFESGDLLCGTDCLWDTTDCAMCGDGIRQGAESCDGVDLGGEDCASLGLMGGTLACSPGCSFDPSACDIPGIPFGSDTGFTGYLLPLGMTTCDDISGTGTPTGLTDDSNQVVPMGFTFSMYGTDYTQANLQSNGTVVFGAASYLTLGNSCLPTATAPSTDVLYVFWDDLNPGAAGEVYYETLGMPGDQRFVVQWDVPNFGGNTGDLMRFQAVFHESSGFIDVCYVDTLNAGNVGDNGAEATSGIQHSSADGFEYSCNMPNLVDGTQLLYIPL
ncbi:MAG: hypothetical protein H6712_14350 [Myxococcales bacterium]|nr:hypothetical protein [Myxococcales bacterium]